MRVPISVPLALMIALIMGCATTQASTGAVADRLERSADALVATAQRDDAPMQSRSSSTQSSGAIKLAPCKLPGIPAPGRCGTSGPSRADPPREKASGPATSGRAAGHIRRHHFLRIDDAVEFGLRDEAQLQRGRLQSQIVVHGVVGDFRRLVIADDR
jgi:hypothetical protein